MLRIFLVTVLISSTLSQRLSERKCQEYKNLTASLTNYGSLSLLSTATSSKRIYRCGDVGFSGLIVGGVKAKVGEFPHAAAIGWRSRHGVEFKCGGSLISERFVLTAAHCATDDFGAPSFVRFGDQNLSNDNDRAVPVEVNIKRFISHPDYDSNNNKHDIALIELQGNVTFNLTSIRPGCLQQSEFTGYNVTAIGWGNTKSFGTTSDELMKVSLPVNQISLCKNKLEHDLLDSSRQICAGGEFGKDTCRGDSGAPIQVAHEDAPCVYNIIGLTSFGSALCGKKAPAVYTKVAAYLDWIEKIVWPQGQRASPLSAYNTRPVYNTRPPPVYTTKATPVYGNTAPVWSWS